MVTPLLKIKLSDTKDCIDGAWSGFEYVLLDFRSWAPNHYNWCPSLTGNCSHNDMLSVVFVFVFTLFSPLITDPNQALLNLSLSGSPLMQQT